MAGYVFKNGAQLLPFRFWVSGYTYLIYGTYFNRVGMNIPPSGLAVLDPEGVDG